MRNWKKSTAIATTGVLLATTFAVPTLPQAHAGSKGRRNTAIALGAVTAYGLIKGNNKVAIGGAVATAYAYKRYKNEKNRERERARWEESRSYRRYSQRGSHRWNSNGRGRGHRKYKKHRKHRRRD